MNGADERTTSSQRVIFGVYLVILNVLLVYLLLKFWPETTPPASDTVGLLPGGRWPLNVPPSRRYLLIVALAGALGSYVHLATSFAVYAGNRQLKASWVWWYVLRPFIGTGLAIILYFVVRGGLLAGNGSEEDLNLYGIAAIAGMAGMFSKQATDKLEEVFKSLFKTDKPSARKDPLKSDEPPTPPGAGDEHASVATPDPDAPPK